MSLEYFLQPEKQNTVILSWGVSSILINHRFQQFVINVEFYFNIGRQPKSAHMIDKFQASIAKKWQIIMWYFMQCTKLDEPAYKGTQIQSWFYLEPCQIQYKKITDSHVQGNWNNTFTTCSTSVSRRQWRTPSTTSECYEILKQFCCWSSAPVKPAALTHNFKIG